MRPQRSGLELMVPPPVVALVLAAGMWGLAKVSVHLAWAGPGRVGVACALFALGVLCAASAAVAFRRWNTTINPHKPEESRSLVRSGPFRYTRNPMYLGLLTVLLGWAVWLGAPWALLGPVAFFIYIQRFQIVPEERVLMEKFGDGYQQYRRAVRRWL
jgi:protein-S-isoprenylcysteine O-methyltransferase Ste14